MKVNPEVKALADKAGDDLKHKVETNTKYAMEQIQRISGSESVYAICHANAKMHELFMMQHTLTTTAGITQAIKEFAATKDPSVLTKSTITVDASERIAKKFVEIHRAAFQLTIYELIDDQRVANQVYNIMAELVNSTKRLLEETIETGIAQVVAIIEKEHKKG